MRIRQELTQRAAENRPIRVGASGADWMGSGFIAAMAHVPGMAVTVLADENVGRGARGVSERRRAARGQIVEADSPGAATDALRHGQAGHHRLLRAGGAAGGRRYRHRRHLVPGHRRGNGRGGIAHGKDIVLINIEADVTVGHILNQQAREAGVLYTVSSGDEPGCLMELVDFVSNLGYEIIVIGKGKNNPLNPAATPDTVAESARKADKDPYQVASYVDGTKTMFEMTCAANATGCRPMQRGMIGPEATLETVSQIFALEEDGGITRFPGAVDFVQGNSMAGGVFVTVRITDDRIRADLEYLKVGKGNYFTFFRPYHLWFLEAPISIARAHLLGEPTLVPLARAGGRYHDLCQARPVAGRDAGHVRRLRLPRRHGRGRCGAGDQRPCRSAWPPARAWSGPCRPVPSSPGMT